jgi:ATP-dependent RNA helicase DDX23/PRP28
MRSTHHLHHRMSLTSACISFCAAFRSCCIVGGASYEDQIGKLRRGAEIVVATPGRLLDCLRRSYAVLNQCNYVVLDEADRMIDLGFEPQVIDVLAAMPSSNLKPNDDDEDGDEFLKSEHTYRTTYMFSATMPPAVERIAKRYLRRPVTVTVGSAGKAIDSVTQRVEWTDKKSKPAILLRSIDRFQAAQTHLSSSDDGFKVIVFVNNRVSSSLLCACVSLGWPLDHTGVSLWCTALLEVGRAS